MKHHCAVLAAFVAFTSVDGQPRGPLAMGAPTHARASLVAVARQDRRVTMLVTLAVDDGWHVSWRNPGETGLPTRLSWSLPSGVRVVRERWPVPVIAHTDVGATHTLEGDVPWLVEFVIDEPDAVDRLVGLTMRYGICREVCIPEQQSVQGALPGSGGGAGALASVPARLRARLAIDTPPVGARLRDGQLCLDRLPPAVTGAGAELVADSGRALDAALPVTAVRAGGARVSLPFSGRLRQPIDTVLVVRAATGAMLPLDFRAAAPRCGPRARRR